MVAVRRQWVRRMALPVGSVSSLRYDLGTTSVLMQFSYQTVQYNIKLPISLRVRRLETGVVEFYAYSYSAYSLLITWTKTLRHLL